MVVGVVEDVWCANTVLAAGVTIALLASEEAVYLAAWSARYPSS